MEQQAKEYNSIKTSICREVLSELFQKNRIPLKNPRQLGCSINILSISVSQAIGCSMSHTIGSSFSQKLAGQYLYIKHFSQPRNWLINEPHNWLFSQPQISCSVIIHWAFQSAMQLAVQWATQLALPSATNWLVNNYTLSISVSHAIGWSMSHTIGSSVSLKLAVQ